MNNNWSSKNIIRVFVCFNILIFSSLSIADNEASKTEKNLLKIQKPFSAFFVDDSFDHAIRSPVTAKPDQTLEFAVKNMEEKQVWDLPVVDTFGMLVGLLHLHPAVKALLEKE